MAEWPDAEELKRVLDVDPESAVWEGTLDRVLAAAIAHVQLDVGEWEEDQEPTVGQAQAALRMAELIALRPEASAGVQGTDPTYRQLLFGTRKRFGFA